MSRLELSVGSRVSYEDMANPRRIGVIVELVELGGTTPSGHPLPTGVEYRVRFEDGSEVVSDCRQAGWRLEPAPTIRRYNLAPLFVWDHWSRDLPENQVAVSTRVVESPRRMVVELDELGYDELMSDAHYYATEMGAAGYDDRAMIRSAGAVVRALEKQGRPS